MWQGRWIRAVALTVFGACALGAPGCGERCRTDHLEGGQAFQAAWGGDIEAMRRLIAQDPGLANARQCPAGATPLHVAAERGHDDVVRLLLEAGATVDSRRIEGLTPLHLAAGVGRFATVRRLLAAGADPNSRESGGWTPLHRAASQGHDNVVRLLLPLGADPRAMDDQRATPLEYAVLNRHHTATELLASRDAAFSTSDSSRAALAQAARDGDAEDVRFLLSKGVELNSAWKGLTPLQHAINPRPPGTADRPDARAMEERQVVELLLTAGANVEVRDKNGRRPLHLAASFGRVDVAELLLGRGAEVDARDTWDWTPLHVAASRREAGMVKLLLEHGADVHARNKAGHSPRDETFGDEQIETLLKNHSIP